MRLPLSWIKLHLPLDETPEKIGEKLTSLGLEVDKIIPEGDEVIFEISLTPNLGHDLSLLGVLRELKAVSDAPFYPPKIVSTPAIGGVPLGLELIVDKSVPLYCCRRVAGIKNGESPDWLKKRLEGCDLQPKHLIVDVMNYVMMELGQPLHAFDAKEIRGKIIVRNAKEGEKFLALDGKEYTLKPHHQVIADEEKVLALAGILGGEKGSVTPETTDIVIEAAHFDPKLVRKASKELSISTEASRRFERGIDHLGVIRGLDRAVMLLEEITGFQGLSEVVKVEYLPFAPRVIPCRLARVEAILGIHLGVDEVSSIWKRLDMPFVWDKVGTFQVTAPSYRNDLKEEIDLIEEVARIWGLDNLPKKIAQFSFSTLDHAPIFLLEREARKNLLSLGLQEWICCDLIDPRKLGIILNQEELPGGLLKVINPSSEEQSVLRPSLLPGLLVCAKHNYDLGNHNLQAFEIGKIHFKAGEQPKEELMASILLTGKRGAESWTEKNEEVDFFDLKGAVEAFLEGMDVRGINFRPHHHSLFHPGRQAALYFGDRLLGVMGEVHPKILRAIDLPHRVYLVELSVHELHPLQKRREKMDPLPQFPSSSRDWTVTVGKTLSFETLQKEIEKKKPLHLETFSLKDIFTSEKLGAEKQNLTFHFVYRGIEETLPQEVIEKEHATLIEALSKFVTTAT
jgi:phenylalanyl-tRNA synthetase beta chain